MNPRVRQRQPRSSTMLIVLFVLCLLGRPLLAIACDVHDATHHDVAELVEMAATGDLPDDPDGESLLHDLLHVAHVSGSVIEMPASSMPLVLDVPFAIASGETRNAFSGAMPRSLLRPPISV